MHRHAVQSKSGGARSIASLCLTPSLLAACLSCHAPLKVACLFSGKQGRAQLHFVPPSLTPSLPVDGALNLILIFRLHPGFSSCYVVAPHFKTKEALTTTAFPQTFEGSRASV